MISRKRGFGCACGLEQSEMFRRGQEKHAESVNHPGSRSEARRSRACQA